MHILPDCDETHETGYFFTIINFKSRLLKYYIHIYLFPIYS